MNFFEQQKHARRISRLFVLLFIATVILVVVAVDIVVALAVSFRHTLYMDNSFQTTFDWGLIGWVSALVLAFIGGASLYRSMQLRRGGGAAIAQDMGGVWVPTDPDDFAWKRLRHVVEEVAIASNVPVPDIYVMEKEAGINAFSAGYAPSNAAICVTQGCLDHLKRDELQGMVAHEFSHILNGDIRLNIRLIGMLYGIFVITIVGRLLLIGSAGTALSDVLGQDSRKSRRSQSGAIFIGGALLVIGYIGHFLGRLIQAAVARSRERLADESAVQFTRQRKGLGFALKKILALPLGSKMRAHNRQEIAHMLFSDGVGSSWFATHPPLIQRIKALDPSFKTEDLKSIRSRHVYDTPQERQKNTRESIMSASPAVVAMATGALTKKGLSPFDSATLGKGQPPLVPEDVANAVAKPDARHFSTATQLYRQIPDELMQAAKNKYFACAVMLALVMADDQDAKKRQVETLRRSDTTAMLKKVQSLHATIATLHPSLWLPLAALTVPCLRRMPASRMHVFLEQLHDMIHADDKVSLDEYCLAKLVRIQVIEAAHPGAAHAAPLRLDKCKTNVRDMVALIACYGNATQEGINKAFRAGIDTIFPREDFNCIPSTDWRKALDKAFERLDRLRPTDKRQLIRGLTSAINADGVVSPVEAELLRIVCAALHCPLPPVIQSAEVG